MKSNRTLILVAVLVALLCLIACGIAGFFYFFWGTDTPVTEADDSLAKVQSTGKIVIGTSADYPPFEYYVSNFQIDVFDIVLMNEKTRVIFDILYDID